MHTGDSHSITPIQWVPQHGTVRNWDQSFGELFRVRSKGVEGNPRPAQNESLEARRRNRDRVRHGDCSSLQLTFRVYAGIVGRGDHRGRGELLNEMSFDNVMSPIS